MKDICRFILESTCRQNIVSISTVISIRVSRSARIRHEILRLTYLEGWREERWSLLYAHTVSHLGKELTLCPSKINPFTNSWL